MLCRLCHLLLPWLDLEEEHLWKSTLKQFFMVVGRAMWSAPVLFKHMSRFKLCSCFLLGKQKHL